LSETAVLKEPLDQGLVTSRHPTSLRPGELLRADNSVYKPNDPFLYRVPGRTIYGTVVAASKVKGLRFLQFDGVDEGLAANFLIGYVGTTYHSSVFSGRTGTFTSVDTAVGDGTTLDAVHYNNRHYLLNGNTTGVANRVWNSALAVPTSRRHGLAPVTDAPTVTTLAGSWPLDDLFFGTGRYYFFYTEVLNPGGADELESAYDESKTPGFVDLQKDASGNIAFDIQVCTSTNRFNTGVTTFRVYMVKTSLFATWDASLLATARQVAEGTFTNATSVDCVRLSAQSVTYGPSIALAGGAQDRGGTLTPSGTVDSIRTNNSVVWTLAGNAGQNRTFDLYNHNFVIPVGATIVGIEVGYKIKSLGVGSMVVNAKLSSDLTAGSPVFSVSKTVNFSADDWQFVKFGGPTDLWGLAWSPAQINQATAPGFGVRTLATSAGFSGKALFIDVIQITIYTQTSVTVGKNYPVVSVQVGNVTTVVSANTPPPVASTGDIFDGQMVLNDVTDHSMIRYSLPDQPDYWPSIYFINFETKEQDYVVDIRRLADILFVGLRHQVYRVNYLPRATDAEFDHGRAYEVLSESQGVITTQGFVPFNPTDSTPMLGYVSDNGLKATDGAQVLSLSEDIDWYNTVDITKLQQSILINYPKQFQLWFYYTPLGGTTNTKALVVHYHPSHVKEGQKFCITGPIDVTSASATVARLTNEWVSLTGHWTDGKVYVEDNGNDDKSTVPSNITQVIGTRDLYAAGIGKHWTMEWMSAFHNKTTPAMTYTSLLQYRNHESDVADDIAPDILTFQTTYDGLSRPWHHKEAEMIRFKLTCADNGDGLNAQSGLMFLSYGGSGHGVVERPSS
jgi:hypothetical protein